MKICLINPHTIYYSTIKDDFVSDSQNTLPYLGLGYVASMLEENGYEVDIFECTRERLWGDKLAKRIEAGNYSIIGISIFDYNFKNASKIFNSIKKVNPNAFIFVGGMYATMEYDRVLKNYKEINCCILGEGEHTTLELINKVVSGETIDDVDGIAFLDEEEIVVTAPRELVDNLNELPFPRRQFMNQSGKIQIKTSRGCENHCLYCATSAFLKKCKGKKLRFRSPQNIVDEILEIIKIDGNVKRVFFIDDSFLSVRTGHEKWLLELCRLLKENNLRMPFDIYARSKGVIKHENLLSELKECGLSSIFIGVESFLDEQLKFFNKKTTVAENITALEILEKHNIACEIGFIPLDHTMTIEKVIENYTNLKNSPVIDIAETFKAFSQNRAVIALNGTPIKTLLVKNNKYVENERGYNFDDERIERFFHITKLWGWKINKILAKGHLTEWCRQNDNIELFREIIKINRAFMDIDVDFVICICNLLKDESPSDEKISAVMDEYLLKLKPINEKYKVLNDEIERIKNGVIV